MLHKLACCEHWEALLVAFGALVAHGTPAFAGAVSVEFFHLEPQRIVHEVIVSVVGAHARA